jgi:mono/diheme cytochrome c family protein
MYSPILKEKRAIMKTTKLAALILTIAVALFILIPSLSWAADDGAALYKAKCAACHGPNGEGKPAAKIPALKSEDVKKLSDEDLTDAIANGGKSKKASHAFASKGMTPDQIKLLVAHIRDLNK